ncbi:MAG: double-strand break repair protein AddB [Planktomarina sp.]|uniref:double-strand break repair protein AddB n=1 Tax=Planktomarina sp. TaxID=2024851 RepID=UPI0032617CF5|nr:double-strand break repair protein AddB [Planktomarina sp.]
MFEDQPGFRVFGTYSGQAFPETLLEGLTTRLQGAAPEQWARVEVYVNTQRMQRRLAELFLQGPARLMPKFHLVTDLAHDPLLSDLPMPVPTLKRRLEIAQLVRKLIQRVEGLAPASAVFDLANSLADLMDEMQGEGIAPDVIEGLDISDFSGHWERALQFITIVQRYFEGGEAPDKEARQRASVFALTQRWQESPPDHPILVAGSTGSRGTTFHLMKAVAGLPQGAVILPGFDFDMPRRVWAQLSDPKTSEDHPQYRFSRLLGALDLTSEQVIPWIESAPKAAARNRLVSLALRPAPVTFHWRQEGPYLTELDQATQDITWLEAPNQRVEAKAIALRLRQAAELGQTAAVISPDRNLTRRIATALAAWNITPDDSAGIPLSLTAPGRFLLHVLDLAQPQLTSETLLVLLKHPLAHSGADRGQHLRNTRELELYLRRDGPAFLTAQTLLQWAETKDHYRPWVDWINAKVFDRWPQGPQPLENWIAHHRTLAEGLSAGLVGDSGQLWEQAPGRDTKTEIENLTKYAPAAGDVDLTDYSAILRGVLNAGQTRNQNHVHSNILIWGTLEARVQSADLVILAGLNDGTWPEPPAPDPWLNRSLRLQAGLLLPERRIGLSAHDFQQAVGAKAVWLTRSIRSDDAETVPSRWLNRIENLLNGLEKPDDASWMDRMRARGNEWLGKVEALEAPQAAPPSIRPSVAPPVACRPESLSVTDIKHLIRDPYAIYAKRILDLKRLDSLTKSADAPLRGTVIHDLLEAFLQTGPWTNAEAAKATLLALAEERLQATVPWPAARRMWLARVVRFSEWFVTQEMVRQAQIVSTKTEIKGEIDLPELNFTLRGTADRIDLLNDGTAHIYDYKTGKPPTQAQQLHFEKQLLLEVEILRRGGFPGLGSLKVTGATYIGLDNAPTELPAPIDEADVWSDLSKLIRAYQSAEQGYAARRAMLKAEESSDYDHLARYGEWSTNQRATIIKVSK